MGFTLFDYGITPSNKRCLGSACFRVNICIKSMNFKWSLSFSSFKRNLWCLLNLQVIVNKSRAQWRSFLTKIPICTDNIEVIPCVSEEIVTMLRSNPKVNLEKDAPYCFLSYIESSFAELTIGCNLNYMVSF